MFIQVDAMTTESMATLKNPVPGVSVHCDCGRCSQCRIWLNSP
jgi:hypothetical protein